MVEHHPSKLVVAGSIPVFRSKMESWLNWHKRRFAKPKSFGARAVGTRTLRQFVAIVNG